MRLLKRTRIAIALAMALSGCSLGGLLGGSAKPPTSLVTVTPAASEPAQIARSAAPGQAVTIATPTVSKELASVRVPVQVSPTDVQYVANLQLVDTPDRLFQGLLEETVRRTTNRVVLDPVQTSLDPTRPSKLAALLQALQPMERRRVSDQRSIGLQTRSPSMLRNGLATKPGFSKPVRRHPSKGLAPQRSAQVPDASFRRGSARSVASARTA